jgi:hypothetical protein
MDIIVRLPTNLVNHLLGWLNGDDGWQSTCVSRHWFLIICEQQSVWCYWISCVGESLPLQLSLSIGINRTPIEGESVDSTPEILPFRLAVAGGAAILEDDEYELPASTSTIVDTKKLSSSSSGSITGMTVAQRTSHVPPPPPTHNIIARNYGNQMIQLPVPPSASLPVPTTATLRMTSSSRPSTGGVVVVPPGGPLVTKSSSSASSSSSWQQWNMRYHKRWRYRSFQRIYERLQSRRRKEALSGHQYAWNKDNIHQWVDFDIGITVMGPPKCGRSSLIARFLCDQPGFITANDVYHKVIGVVDNTISSLSSSRSSVTSLPTPITPIISGVPHGSARLTYVNVNDAPSLPPNTGDNDDNEATRRFISYCTGGTDVVILAFDLTSIDSWYQLEFYRSLIVINSSIFPPPLLDPNTDGVLIP